ncbi:MAG TPA: 23S rRNA (uracil(1939)-C(5))-methyltransferase RlmD [Candidatus Tectomicrobia bacterium]|jgi:23S rRNA (uracil1939-C5)-methyltransferase
MPRRGRKIHKTRPQVQPALSGGTVTIERLAYGGDGVGHLDGLTVFVPRTAPGDVVDVRLTNQRRQHAFGEVVTVHHPSPWRVPAPCPLYDHCGGCHLQHLGYAHQLAVKTTQVRDCLERIGKLPAVPIASTLGSPQPFAYRNKVLYHYDSSSGALGLVERHGPHILDVPHCLLSDPRADAVMAQVRALAATESALRQSLHQVQVQVGQRTAEVLVTVIVRQVLAPDLQHLLWEHLHHLATGLLLHVKTQDTPAVFAGTTTAIAGAEVIHERIGTHRFRLEPQAFFQVNTVQMERLYQLVWEAAALRGEEIVLDLYSGGGTIALTLAPHCAQVYAVEVSRQATLLAMQQAREFGVTNCDFRTGKVERILYRYLAQGLRPDLAVLDPPRAGCHPEALQALARLRVPRLVYVSCSPPTLARDLRRLDDLGYRTTGIQPLDMFPQTYHVECVATLAALRN